MVSANRSEQLFGRDDVRNQERKGHSFIDILEDFTRQIKANDKLSKKVLRLIKDEVEMIEGDNGFKLSIAVSVAGSVLFTIIGGLSELGMPKEVQKKIIESLVEQLNSMKG